MTVFQFFTAPIFLTDNFGKYWINPIIPQVEFMLHSSSPLFLISAPQFGQKLYSLSSGVPSISTNSVLQFEHSYVPSCQPSDKSIHSPCGRAFASSNISTMCSQRNFGRVITPFSSFVSHQYLKASTYFSISQFVMLIPLHLSLFSPTDQ